MASIRREIAIEARPEQVWDALRDVGALHTRLAAGFVTHVELEPGARVVTFANGMVARELIVTVDDEARRLVWSVVGGQMTHHNASAQVLIDIAPPRSAGAMPPPDGAQRCRFVWIADLLPDSLAPVVDGMMQQGLAAVKKTVERAAR